jgi:signal peptide peptidase SppA
MSNNSTSWVLSHRWAILPEMLDTIIAIADRQTGFDESKFAITAKDNQPLKNTRRADVRACVAIIPVIGPIFPRANMFTNISGATSIQTLAKDFTTALNDPEVESIVLNIDSPGGEVTGVSEFADMIYNARGDKPVTAYVYGLGASAAYWIASSASKIVISSTAEAGSIGVVSGYQDTREKDKKEGVTNFEIVSSYSPNKRPDPATDAGKAQIQKIVDDLAIVFISDVARNRGVSTDKVIQDYGQGGVFIGRNAVASGMADSVGSFEGILEEEIKRNATNVSARMVAAVKPVVIPEELETQAARLEKENVKLYDNIFFAGRMKRELGSCGGLLSPEAQSLKKENPAIFDHILAAGEKYGVSLINAATAQRAASEVALAKQQADENAMLDASVARVNAKRR